MQAGVGWTKEGKVRAVTKWRVVLIPRFVKASDVLSVLVAILPLLRQSWVPHHVELVRLLVVRHTLLEPTSEVVIVPPRLDEQYTTTRSKTGVCSGLIPIIEQIAAVNAVRLLHVFQGIVDDEDVSSLARNTTTHTSRSKTTPFRCVPSLRTLRVRVEPSVREHGHIVPVTDYLPNLPGELHR